jgi:hypothetical protein
MTVTSQLPVHLHRGKHRRSVWLGGVLTGTVVAMGAAVATWTLPDVATPDNVVRTFFEARDAHDWAKTWALTCQQTRSEIGGHAEYLAGLAYLDRYHDEYSDSYTDYDDNLEIDDVRAFKGPSGPSASVSITWTSDMGNFHWEGSKDVLVVKESGELHVCDKGFWMW